MRKIGKPTFQVQAVLIDSIDNMRNKTLKSELSSSVDIFNDAELDFETKKNTNDLFQIPQNQEISKIANANELKKLYTDRMVNQDNKARNYYDKIIISAPDAICPLCGQRMISTLDHYLPKSLYPLLSITPINLIPSCSDCNKGKLAAYPSNSQEECLHPYYDDVEDFCWLKMRLVQAKPFVVEFYVDPPAGTSLLLAERIKFHFNNYSLNSLYTTHAAETFSNFRMQFEKLYNNKGGIILQEHLTETYQSSYNNHKNSWHTAFYYELSNNPLFYNGGFI